MGAFILVLMFLTALFLIVLILLQRGRGGGLAGALGGMGGQSAFGAKAGDVFTRITSGLAIFWIILCVTAVKYFGATSDAFDTNLGQNVPNQTGTEIEKLPDAPNKTTPGKSTPGKASGGAPKAKAEQDEPAGDASPKGGASSDDGGGSE